MNWLLITAALACHPGDRLVDLRDKIPRGAEFDRPRDHRRAVLRALLYLSAGVSGEHAALLRQQADINYQGAGRRRPLLRQAKPAADEVDSAGAVAAGYSDVIRPPSVGAATCSRVSPQANCAMPWPTDQFSFADSRMFTNTFSGRVPGLSPSSSAVRRNSAFFCCAVRVSNTVIWMYTTSSLRLTP